MNAKHVASRLIETAVPEVPAAQPSTNLGDKLILVYREPGRRPGSTRWARRPVRSVRDAIDWMNANKETAFLPASVETRGWRPEVMAILN